MHNTSLLEFYLDDIDQIKESPLNESQSQEIGNYYKSFSKKYNLDLDELVYGKDGFMNSCYPNGFPDFAGDVIYSEKYWNEFEKWLKDNRGIELQENLVEEATDYWWKDEGIDSFTDDVDSSEIDDNRIFDINNIVDCNFIRNYLEWHGCLPEELHYENVGLYGGTIHWDHSPDSLYAPDPDEDIVKEGDWDYEYLNAKSYKTLDNDIAEFISKRYIDKGKDFTGKDLKAFEEKDKAAFYDFLHDKYEEAAYNNAWETTRDDYSYDNEDDIDEALDEDLTEAKKKKKPYDSKSITTGNIAYNLSKFNQRMGTAFPGNDNNNPSTEEAKAAAAAAQAANNAVADGAGDASGSSDGGNAGGDAGASAGGAAGGCSESLKENIEYTKENQFVFTPEEQEEYNCDEEGNSNEGYDQYVHCGWCGEVWPTSECREEVTFGYICSRCEDELHYHGGELMFVESKENLTEAKRYVRRYFIRPQQIFCSNKSEILKALIDLNNENCSVYTLNNLGDIKDVTKLTNDDIIYYYDDGILYDKNHVKVMDYDLSIKHEEERKKFAGTPTESDLKSDEYDDRMTKATVVEAIDWTDKLLDEYYDGGEAIESDQELNGMDNAVVDCQTEYKVIAHSEDEKPLDCKIKKAPLEKPLTETVEQTEKVPYDLAKALQTDKNRKNSNYNWETAEFEEISKEEAIANLEAYSKNLFGLAKKKYNNDETKSDYIVTIAFGNVHAGEIRSFLGQVFPISNSYNLWGGSTPEYLIWAIELSDKIYLAKSIETVTAKKDRDQFDSGEHDTSSYKDLSPEERRDLAAGAYKQSDIRGARNDWNTNNPINRYLASNRELQRKLFYLTRANEDIKKAKEQLKKAKKKYTVNIDLDNEEQVAKNKWKIAEKEYQLKQAEQKIIEIKAELEALKREPGEYVAKKLADYQNAIDNAIEQAKKVSNVKTQPIFASENLDNIDLNEAKKDDELPIDPEAAKLEVHTKLNDLVADEIEAINGYEDAKSEILDAPISHKDTILDTIDHIKDEEKEHIDELINATAEIPFDKDTTDSGIEEPVVEKESEEEIEEAKNEFDLTFESYNAYGEKLTEAQEKFTCCICGEESYGYGNNPAPVKEEGRCCDSCNAKFVIPARIEAMHNEKNEELDNNSR